MNRIVVLIDDEPTVAGGLDIIKENLKRKNIDVISHYINPIDDDFCNDDDDPILIKVIDGIKSCLKGVQPNLFIIDLSYSGGSEFDGLDLIESLRDLKKFKNTPILLSSGKRKAVVKKIFGNEDLTEIEKVNELAKLIDYKIDGFIEKNYKDEAIKLLQKVKIDDLLPSKLRNFECETANINIFSPILNTLTFSELADEIEGNEPIATEILNEMLDMTLSNYVEIDEKL